MKPTPAQLHLPASRFTRAISGFAIALLALASAANLRADPYVRVLVYAYDQNSGNGSIDTGQIAGPLAIAESGPFSDFGGSFDAKAYATYGILGAYSRSTNTYPLYQSFTPAEAWWSDTFTVTGAPNTQVTFNFGLHLDDALSAVKYPGFPDNLGAVAVAQLHGMGAAAGLAINDSVSNSGANLAADRTVWKLATFNVGDVVTVGADLYTDASAQGGTATADAYSTGRFAMEVVTPGGGYNTANGVVFTTSFVPEPSTYALLGFGALGLLGLRRKKSVTA